MPCAETLQSRDRSRHNTGSLISMRLLCECIDLSWERVICDCPYSFWSALCFVSCHIPATYVQSLRKGNAFSACSNTWALAVPPVLELLPSRSPGSPKFSVSHCQTVSWFSRAVLASAYRCSHRGVKNSEMSDSHMNGVLPKDDHAQTHVLC